MLEDIFSDLTENLERIRTHGDRADRIVNDMLMMSRESVGHQLTNINNLLDEHARLAYHQRPVRRTPTSNWTCSMTLTKLWVKLTSTPRTWVACS